MRTLKRFLVLAVPALLVAADEPADQLAPNDVTVHLILLRQKSVQEALKLTPELTKKVVEFTNKEYEAFQKAMQLGEKEREAKLLELEKANQKFLADNLTAAQNKRLDQITMQVTGLQQLTRPEVVKLLSLTEAQQRKFAEMQKEARKELEGILGAKDREGRNEKLAKLRADIDQKVEAVLTREQKEKAKELVGEPFKGRLLLEGPEAAPKGRSDQ
jgi:Spy/CpxP family protein refolding chaperone